MNVLKGYFAPAKSGGTKKKGEGKEKAVVPAMEMTMAPGSPAFKTPMSSRPASLYPEGDFRDQGRDSILDIKTDVMASWLHQQQLENLWAMQLPGEGVVLKKARDNFACCPASLYTEQNGLFENVSAMNVRVSILIQYAAPR
jgi:hypothetical protein